MLLKVMAERLLHRPLQLQLRLLRRTPITTVVV